MKISKCIVMDFEVKKFTKSVVNVFSVKIQFEGTKGTKKKILR